MENEKENYARILTGRANAAVKIIKALVIASGVLAAGLFVFVLVTLLAVDDTKAMLIGMIVFISGIAVLLIGVLAAFIYAKINLNKLKNLE